MTSSHVFTIASAAEGDRVLEALARRFPVVPQGEDESERVYYDTFDWRVRRARRLLSLEEVAGARWLCLEPLGEGRPERISLDGDPTFVDRLPAGAVRRWLDPVVDIRRLLPRVAVREERRTLGILDDEEKTVCRVVLEGGSSWRPSKAAANGTAALPPRLLVVPLRGYDAAARRVERALREELGLENAADRGFDLALSTCGLGPLADPSRPRIELDPADPAESAVRSVLRAYLDIVESNEQGTRQELDTEFLHDFRVGVRRTRSVLGSMKEVFPADAIEHFTAELRWLGGLTGPARDLDVYLLELAGNEERRELADYLAIRRREEQAIILEGLGSERWRRLASEWRAFLTDGPEQIPDVGRRPVIDVVSWRIRRVHTGLVKRGRAIRKKTSARKIHNVRLRAKKLRYMLDAFRSLYDRKGIEFVISHLKKLQDVLGRFNDLEVQQASLERFAYDMDARGMGSVRLFLTMGREIEAKRAECEHVRRSVGSRFSLFDEPETRRRCHDLFDREDG